MGDSIRAAMTCIRFYQENALSFQDLLNNVHFLHKAEEHLKHGVEQEQWVEVATGKNIFQQLSFLKPGNKQVLKTFCFVLVTILSRFVT